MLANCEFMMSTLLSRTKRIDEGEPLSDGGAARLKGHCSKLTRETVALARECMGGNGILAEYGVARTFVDVEAIYTYEGTYDINMLVAGRELTGGIPAFI
jgi:alkylation response protein AidB-like acyl-CoA dehydrogenase